MEHSSDVAFSAAVKAVQQRKGSRAHYAAQEAAGGWRTKITLDLKAFIEAQTSVFFATASAAAQPYVQHRGGPAGFLRVEDERTIAFVDFTGNRQYISLGNLAENPKAQLFLIDYATRQRVKIWGRATVTEGDAALVARLMPVGYRARAAQVITLAVTAWDANCPQHIPQRFAAADVEGELAARDRRIRELEAELERVRAALAR